MEIRAKLKYWPIGTPFYNMNYEPYKPKLGNTFESRTNVLAHMNELQYNKVYYSTLLSKRLLFARVTKCSRCPVHCGPVILLAHAIHDSVDNYDASVGL